MNGKQLLFFYFWAALLVGGFLWCVAEPSPPAPEPPKSTLRDELAKSSIGSAFTILQNKGFKDQLKIQEVGIENAIAREAYAIADQMLKEREIYNRSPLFNSGEEVQ